MSQKRVRIIFPFEDGILLELMDDPAYPENWGKKRLPGGGVKPGETFLAAAMRELWEEFGARWGNHYYTLRQVGTDPRPEYAYEVLFLSRHHRLTPGSYTDRDSGKTITIIKGHQTDERYIGPELTPFLLHDQPFLTIDADYAILS